MHMCVYKLIRSNDLTRVCVPDISTEITLNLGWGHLTIWVTAHFVYATMHTPIYYTWCGYMVCAQALNDLWFSVLETFSDII